MISISPLWIISIVSLIIFSFLLIIFSKIFTNSIDKNEFSFKRIFPFEVINNLKKFKSGFLIILFALVVVSFLPIFLISLNSGLMQKMNISAIIISSIFGLAFICYSFLFFFNPSSVKTHLLLFVIFFSTTLCSGLSSGILGLNIYKLNIENGNDSIIQLILSCLLFVCSLFLIIKTLTSNLKNWAYLNSSGEILERPKVFPLAYLEWLTFFVLIFEEILYYFVLLKY